MIILGEKDKIKKAIEEARKERGPLSAKEKKQIAKKIHKKEKKIIGRRALIAVFGLSTIIGGTKLLEEPKDDRIPSKAENQNIEKDIKMKNFKEQYKYDIENQETSQEPRDFEQEIKELKTEEEVIKFVKDMYIEEYEQTTGDTTRTTEDIKVWYGTYLNYAYINDQTGDYITPGETPAITKQKLQNDGISCDNVIDDVKIYKITDNNGRMLDAVTLQTGQPTKVISGDQYGEPYISILDKMGDAIPRGLDYAQYIEQGDELSIGIAQDRFIEAAKEYEMTKENQNLITEKQAEYGE